MNAINTIIIDDEYFNRQLISLLVKRHGPPFEIKGLAAGLREGAALIEQFSPDLIFLDLKMPDGDGPDLILHKEKWDFEVVLVSGFDDYASPELLSRVFAYVLKPIDTEKFSEILRSLERKLCVGDQKKGGGETERKKDTDNNSRRESP